MIRTLSEGSGQRTDARDSKDSKKKIDSEEVWLFARDIFLRSRLSFSQVLFSSTDQNPLLWNLASFFVFKRREQNKDGIIGLGQEVFSLLFLLYHPYELQFDLSRDAGFDYAPRQLFASKIKPPT
jgi:hypothetical protein